MRLVFYVIMALMGIIVRHYLGWEGICFCILFYLLGVWAKYLSE